MKTKVSIFKSNADQDAFLKTHMRLLNTWTVPFEQLWLETNFGKTHVIVAGPADGEPLVLLPGGHATGAMWGPMLPELIKQHRVFCLDLVDQVGLSEPTKVFTNTEDSNAWLIEILEKLSLTKISLAGYSLGGFIASTFAVKHFARIHKLVICAPAATVASVSVRYILSVLVASVLPSRRTKLSFLDNNSAGLVEHQSELFQVLLSAMTGSKIVSKIMPKQLKDEELAVIGHSTLVLLGGKDISSTVAAQKTMQKLKPMGFKGEVFDSAGHFWAAPQMEHASKLISQFLSNKLTNLKAG